MGFEKTAILGVGLIGASLALALRQKGLTKSISGFGRTEEKLKKAKERGIIDFYCLDPAHASEGADLVVLATPPSSFTGLAEKIRPSVGKDALVIDAGSVKGAFVEKMEEILPGFVGCHPIAGGNTSGIEAADGALFEGALVIVTKTGQTQERRLEEAVGLWKSIGSAVEVMDPERHDRIYALLSHMPHMVAYALVNTVGDVEGSLIKYAGRGFKDMTRIAMSPPPLWREICEMNKENILGFLEDFKRNIEELSGLLKQGNSDALEMRFKEARSLREGIEQG